MTLFHPSAPNAPPQLHPWRCAFHPLPPSWGRLISVGCGAHPLLHPVSGCGCTHPTRQLAKGFGLVWLCRGHAHSHHVPVLVLSWLLPWIFKSPQQILGTFFNIPWRGRDGHREPAGPGMRQGLDQSWGSQIPPLGHPDPTSISPRMRGHGTATCYSPAVQLPAWDDKLTPAFGGRYLPGTAK